MGKVSRNKSTEKKAPTTGTSASEGKGEEEATGGGGTTSNLCNPFESHLSETNTPTKTENNAGPKLKKKSKKSLSSSKKVVRDQLRNQAQTTAEPLSAEQTDSVRASTSSSTPNSLSIRIRKKSAEYNYNADLVARKESNKTTSDKETVSDMEAQDIPIPTTLARHANQSTPGAFRLGNDADEDEILSEQAPETEHPKPAIVTEPPLLQATLVVEDDDRGTESATAAAAATTTSPQPPKAVVAYAEPMDDHNNEDKESPVSHSPVTRRRLYLLVLLLALVCCVAVGVIVGLVMSNKSDSGDDSDAELNDLPATGNKGEEDGVEEDTIHRATYLLKYGFGAIACKGPLNLDIEVACAATELEILDTENADCVKNNGSTYTCTVRNIPDGPREGKNRNALRKRVLQETISRVHTATLLVSCTGDFINDNSEDFALEGRVKEVDKPLDCEHVWYEERTDGTLAAFTRVVGGSTAAMLTGYYFYEDDDGKIYLEEDTSCRPALQEKVFVETINEPNGNEELETIYCGSVDACTVVRTDCRETNDPCDDLECYVSADRVTGNFGATSIGIESPHIVPLDDMEGNLNWNEDNLWDVVWHADSTEAQPIIEQIMNEALQEKLQPLLNP
jgi:hypothetical protein